MRAPGLDGDAGSPAREDAGREGRGTGEGGRYSQETESSGGDESAPRPRPAKRPCRRPGWGWGGGPRATVPPLPLSAPPPRVSVEPRGWDKACFIPKVPLRIGPGAKPGAGATEERERSGAHSWPRRRLPRLLGVPRPPPPSLPAPGRVGGGVGRGGGGHI